MCIVFLYLCREPNPDRYHLIIASNRDEFYFRPTASAKFWKEYPNIIAGMDLEPGKKGGTWLGITTDGKFAAVTNYRQAPKFIDPKARGRGHLVPDFLKGSGDVQSYLEAVGSEGDKYNGFNLLVGKLSQNGETKIGWYCNVEDKQVTMLEPGIHVLSNKVLNCFWPKMAYGRERFAEILEETSTKEELVDKLMGLLSTRQRHFSCGDSKSFLGPQDEGGNEDLINACRAIFVNCKELKYGTRTNTVLLVDKDGHATYVERTMDENASDPDEADWKVSTYEFKITEKSGNCADNKSPKENLSNGTSVHVEGREESTRNNHEFLPQNHSKKKRSVNENSSPVEPARKVKKNSGKE